MKLFATTLVAAGLVAAQSIDDLPDCAKTCLNDFISGSQIADCSRTDVGCICANDDFIGGIGCCLLDGCEEDAQTAAIQYAATICAVEDVSVPTVITCATGTADSGSSVTATATGTADSDSTATSTSDGATTTATAEDESTTTGSDSYAGPTAAAGMGGLAVGVLAAAALL
ncbi:hypothetical protein MKZ38_002236 [Zalerion maritima]|uniref:CFEM domain-containing protein n=1 Tax=Zalerion maritima TaxID=339359 RepID=A0AAD5WMX2_9PEZI|nr:hypothetical protein MKZ38_002236 [Zalerion maritima]